MNYKIILLLLSLLILNGCSHSLSLTNEDDYYASSPMFNKENISIGILPAQSSEDERLLEEIVDNIRSLGTIKVKYPYAMNKGHEVNYIIDFGIQKEYKGNPINFLISFPGFYVFAPWWNGYKYSTNINTKITIFDYNSSDVLLSKKIETVFHCKHSEFDRTWTQGVDWLATYGLASLVGGIYYMTYDDDITSDFLKKVSPNYGKYIARKFVTSMSSI